MRGITDDDMENVCCELNTKPGFDDWEGYTNYAIATWERFSIYHEKGEFCDVEIECCDKIGVHLLLVLRILRRCFSPPYQLLKENKEST